MFTLSVRCPRLDGFGNARRAILCKTGGLRVQLYSEKKKFKARMSYADKLGVPYVIFVGEDEIAGGVLSVKDMTTGVQRKLSVDAAAEDILADLYEHAACPVIID